ncbi:MAG: sugar phosphate nucleotidyltransferase [Verrucomicrobiota bacterium]
MPTTQIHTAFILGAGLGTRLRPLTESLPKPLIPVFQKPLITYAFDHLLHNGLQNFIVNTHHQPNAYTHTFPNNQYRDTPLTFRFEPILLETAGGIANIAELLQPDQPLLIYNGDILTDLPIQPAIDHHLASGNTVTLILRSKGAALHIAWNPDTQKVTDIHNNLGTNPDTGFQFTGIYLVSPDFIPHLTPGKKESVIPIFLDLIKNEQSIGAVLADDNQWWDLGNRKTYLDAHATLAQNHAAFPAYGARPEQQRIHPSAQIHPSATICPSSSVGADTVVEADATLTQSVLWPRARATASSTLNRCILRHDAVASGLLTDADL